MCNARTYENEPSKVFLDLLTFFSDVNNCEPNLLGIFIYLLIKQGRFTCMSKNCRKCRGVFRTPSNTYDGALFQKSSKVQSCNLKKHR